MNALDENSIFETRQTGIGPGERLQAARIQRGFSLEDVAHRMHLSVAILQSIEENNFEQITAPIFVKGYLRAYARIVALDEDDMIQQYSEFYSEEDPPITSTSNMAHELAITDARVKTMTYLVILVLLVLLAAWWWNKEQNSGPPISLDSQSSDSQTTDVGESTADAQEPAAVITEIEAVSDNLITATEAVDATPEEAVPEAAVGLQAEPVASIAVEEGPLEVEPVAATSAATEITATPVVAAGEETEASAPVAAAVADSSASAPRANSSNLLAPSGTDRLKIDVFADTWADIKDSSNYQLVYDLLRADQSLELVGAAPFSVFLGNGRGVKIFFNDAQIEFSNRVRDDNTARLKIQN